jgi:hypothetical protein
MKFKEYTFTGVEQLINDDNDRKLKAAWKNSLGHQIADRQLPEFEVVKESLSKLFKEIKK